MFAHIAPPLLAADVWEIVIAFVFFILYGIGQLISAREEAKKKPPRRREPRPPREPAENPPLAKAAAQPRHQEEALRNEVEEFLRRAQGKANPQQKPERKKSPPERRQEPMTPRQAVATEQTKPQRQGPILASPITSPADDLRSESLSEHVAKHINSQKLAEHAELLGDEVALADENLETRLHARFDHQLGSLRHRDDPAVVIQQPNLAEEIAEMLRRPEGVRQLIVAQEILRRPVL